MSTVTVVFIIQLAFLAVVAILFLFKRIVWVSGARAYVSRGLSFHEAFMWILCEHGLQGHADLRTRQEGLKFTHTLFRILVADEEDSPLSASFIKKVKELVFGWPNSFECQVVFEIGSGRTRENVEQEVKDWGTWCRNADVD